jgi:hypothetical protein
MFTPVSLIDIKLRELSLALLLGDTVGAAQIEREISRLRGEPVAAVDLRLAS